MKLIKTKLEGLDFWYRSDDKFVGQRIALGKYEEYETILMLSQVKKESVVVDVGANIGYYTLLLVQKCKKVYAFEPDKECFLILKKNVEENKLGNVVLINKAVGDKNEQRAIIKDKSNYGNSRVGEGKGVECVRLDDVIKEKVDLMKIDVQGYEEKVIEGAKKIIKKDKPILFIECYKKIKFLDNVYRNIFTIDYWFYVCRKGVQIDKKTGYADLLLTNKSMCFWNRYKNIQWKKVIKDIMGYV